MAGALTGDAEGTADVAPADPSRNEELHDLVDLAIEVAASTGGIGQVVQPDEGAPSLLAICRSTWSSRRQRPRDLVHGAVGGTTRRGAAHQLDAGCASEEGCMNPVGTAITHQKLNQSRTNREFSAAPAS